MPVVAFPLTINWLLGIRDFGTPLAPFIVSSWKFGMVKDLITVIQLLLD
jgi:hypothetical protein